MARKRKSNGPSEAESQDVADPEGDATMEEASSPELTKPVYLVAEREDEESVYSIIKIAAAATSRVALERGMSFVTANSEHGSWIVGVGVGGGLRAGTIIFNPDTLRMYHGPRLNHPKYRPVLISHGGEVYAISRRPRLVPRGEVLSRQQQDRLTAAGTYAFHVVNKTWDKVHDDNLPFDGQAVPLDGNLSLFAACPVVLSSNTTVSLMSIKVLSPSTSTAATSSTPVLSIQEFPVAAAGDKIPRPLSCPLGNHSFCAVRLGSVRRRRKSNSLKQIQVILTTFHMQKQSIDAISTAHQSHGTEGDDLIDSTQVKEQNYTYKIKGQSHCLLDSDMPVVAALYM